MSANQHNQAHPNQKRPVTNTNNKAPKRPVEKNLPQLAQHQLQEAFLYNKLLALERQLDAVLVRKRLDIQESLSRQPRIPKTLRLRVQHKLSLEQNSSINIDESFLILQLSGNLLGQKGGSSRQFSSFFKSFRVELCSLNTLDNADQNMSVDGVDSSSNVSSQLIAEWHNTAQTTQQPQQLPNQQQQQSHSDGFEIKRPLALFQQFASEHPGATVKISLKPESHPEKFRLSALLGNLLNLAVDTKTAVIMAFWQYIKINRLQDSSDHRFIHADQQLQQCFNVQSFSFSQVPELISPHLSPLEPVVIELPLDSLISSNSDSFSTVALVDLQVDVEDPIKEKMMKFIVNTSTQKEYAMLDQQMNRLVQQCHVHKLKRDFMSTFANNPSQFLEKWIASQSRDLEIVLGDTQVNAELQRRAHFYKESWVADGVFHYLASK